jgi:hypothetical protein
MVLVPKSVLAPGQLEQIQLQDKIETYGKWVGLGKEVGIAVNDGIRAITAQADTLSHTKLGTYIMFLIGWKVMGKDLVQLLVGIPLLFFGILIWCIAIFKFRKSVSELSYWGWGSFGILIVYILVCVAIIFI